MKHDFVLTIDDGIISSSLVEFLTDELNFPKRLFRQRKAYHEYYHDIKDYPCWLGLEDLNLLAHYGRLEWMGDFNLTLVI